jgi:Flp pilus assembly pilin Flp
MIKMLIYKGGEQEMKRNLKRGQSILEYTLLLAMVIALILFVLFSSGGLRGKMETSYTNVGTAISNVSGKMNTGVFAP